MRVCNGFAHFLSWCTRTERTVKDESAMEVNAVVELPAMGVRVVDPDCTS